MNKDFKNEENKENLEDKTENKIENNINENDINDEKNDLNSDEIAPEVDKEKELDREAEDKEDFKTEQDRIDFENEEIRKKKEELRDKLNEAFVNKNRKENLDNNNNMKNKFKKIGGKFNFKGFIMLLFIITIVMSIPSFLSESNKKSTEVAYSDFIKVIDNKNIKIVKEKEGYVYAYLNKEDLAKNESSVHSRMITDRLGDDKELINVITTNRVSISSEAPAETPFLIRMLMSWFPIILLVGVWVFMLGRINKGGGGGGSQIFSMGKSKAKENGEKISNVTFKDVAGIDEAKQELKEVVEFLREPEKFRAIGARIPRGVLLLGSPGTGKTLLAKAVAGEAKVPFFSMSGSEFVEMFVGVGASRVRDLFNKARKATPCIIFIDEIDAVGRKRGSGQGGGNDEREQTLNQLLVEMDGFSTDETIIVLAATNRPDVLDRALTRPGRFDRQVTVDKPDLKGRTEILEVHAKNKRIASDVVWKTIAKKTAGLVGADLANILNEAAILAARLGKKEITMSDLEEASEKVAMGPEKRSKVVSDEDKSITAYHEAGHAVVNHVIGGKEKVHKITIIPRGFAGGYTMSLPEEEKIYQTKKQYMDKLLMLFGGRAAEELIFGDENITTGASNDIERATAIVQFMVTKVGMNKKFGPILLDGTQDGDMFQKKYYSEQTGKEIDDEVRKILNESYEQTIKILSDNMDKLKAVTNVLLEKETIMGEEFEEIMNA